MNDCKIISLVNQKGGVGKTTSSINIASSLAIKGFNVLIVDLDPQGNCSTGLGIQKELFHESNIYHSLLNLKPINECIYNTSIKNLRILPSDINLSAIELELVNEMARESRLKNILDNCKQDFNFIIIDCPPSLSLLTINALNASSHYIVPMLPEMYSLEGYSHLEKTISKVKNYLGNPIENIGVLLTMMDKRNNLHKEIAKALSLKIHNKMFNTMIPRNIKLSEAVNFGKPIILYNKKASGNIAYEELTSEIINRLGDSAHE